MTTLIDEIIAKEKQLVQFQKQTFDITTRMLKHIGVLKNKLANEKLVTLTKHLKQNSNGNICIIVKVTHDNKTVKKIYLYDNYKKEIRLIKNLSLGIDIQNWYSNTLIEIK